MEVNKPTNRDLAAFPEEYMTLAQAAQVADQVAQGQVLADYRLGKEPNTIRRQRGDLACFEAFLKEAGAPITYMAEELALWAPISPGLVKAFVRWQIKKKLPDRHDQCASLHRENLYPAGSGGGPHPGGAGSVDRVDP